MRVRFGVSFAALVGFLAWQVPVRAGTDTTRTVTIQVAFATHTSLHVSSSHLVFDVGQGPAVARSSIGYVAAARTHSGGQVVLTVEPGTLDADGQALALVCEGPDGEVVLSEGHPQIVGRWIGSGSRTGRLDFTLRGATRPGTYEMDLRFVLSAP